MRRGLYQKVRKNLDYLTATSYLNQIGAKWSLVPPTGKGHPILLVEHGGKSIRFPISVTPGRTNPNAVIASIKDRISAIATPKLHG